MSLLLLRAVAYSLSDGRKLFDQVDFDLGAERVGLVGRNGQGKSTLAGIMAGVLQPSSGHVARSGRVGLVLQNPPMQPGATVQDALLCGAQLESVSRVLDGTGNEEDWNRATECWDLRDRVTAQLASFGLDHLTLHTPLGALSGGERTLLALADALLTNPEILVLDEPTNHLDRQWREAVYRRLEEWPSGLVTVSHDRELLARVDRIVELSASGLQEYGGSLELYMEQKSTQEAAAARKVIEARRELKHELAVNHERMQRQAKRASTAKANRKTENQATVVLDRRKERSDSGLRRLSLLHAARDEQLRSRLQNAIAEAPRAAEIALFPPESCVSEGKIVLQASGVELGFGPARIDGFEWVLQGPRRVALTGLNGTGKTTLLRTIAGDLRPQRGQMSVAVACAYMDQRTAALDASKSALEIILGAGGAIDQSTARTRLAQIGLPGDRALLAVSKLSGGERLKLALMAAMHRHPTPQLLLLDEPTNHLDLESAVAAEEALRRYGGALIVASHDHAFLERVRVDVVVQLGGGSARFTEARTFFRDNSP